MKAIETTDLTKYYGKSRGIIDLNMNVEEGDIFGFIGPNGAGKSTFYEQVLKNDPFFKEKEIEQT